MVLINGPSARMKTLTTTKARIESQLMATAERLTAVREDEDRLAKRIARVNDDIYSGIFFIIYLHCKTLKR
jgi:hypothetical protein